MIMHHQILTYDPEDSFNKSIQNVRKVCTYINVYAFKNKEGGIN